MADTMVSGVVECLVRCFEAVRRCAQSLTDAGFEPPSWTKLANKATKPSPAVHGRSPLDDAHGCRKGFDALPAGAFGVGSLHDDAHQQDDQN